MYHIYESRMNDDHDESLHNEGRKREFGNGSSVRYYNI